MKVLLSRDVIQARIQELGRQIAADYEGREPHLVGVLKGACPFVTDLARSIDLPLTLDFIAVVVLRRRHQVLGRGEAGQGPRPGPGRSRPAGGRGHRGHRPHAQLPR